MRCSLLVLVPNGQPKCRLHIFFSDCRDGLQLSFMVKLPHIQQNKFGVFLRVFVVNMKLKEKQPINLHKLRNNAFDCYFYAFTEKQFYKQPTLHDVENLEPTIYVFT